MTAQTTEQQVTNRKVQVHNGKTPGEDRFVSLTTHRLLARTVFVAAVVDGTNRLADDKSLLTTTDYERARCHANRLVQSLGKAEPTHYAEHLPGATRNPMRRAYGLEPVPKRIAKGRLAYVEQPTRNKAGRWVIAWSVVGVTKEQSKSFATEREAIAFRAQLREEMDDA